MSFQYIADLEAALRSGCLTARELHSVWDQRLPVPDPAVAKKSGSAPDPAAATQIAWMQNDARLVARFTRCALDKEEFRLACDCAKEALRLWDRVDDNDRLQLVHVRMHHAAALARLGYARRARLELEACLDEGFRPRLGSRLKTDILLQLGDIVRQESRHAPAQAARAELAAQALEFYQRALAADPDRLTALSRMASVAFTIGEDGSALRARAHGWARLVLERVRDREKDRGGEGNERDFQTTAMRAEAQAVLGDTDAAAASYGELSKLSGAGVPDLAEARYWSQFLAEGSGQPPDFFRKAFPPLPLVVFAGHAPDLPGQQPRFPPYAVPAVRETVEGALSAHHALVGMSSAAAGAELLFLDALRRRGGTAHIVLPWSQAEFRRTSVRPYEPAGGEPPQWEPLFDHAVEEAATVREIGQSFRNESGVGFEYQLEVIAGLALHAARVSRLDVQPMVLWDEKPGRGLGGTHSFVDFWRRRFGLEPIILRLPPVVTEPPAVVGGIDGTRPVYDLVGWPEPRCERAVFRQEVKTMLFADIVGYSKLNESVIPEFVNHFLARLSRVVAESRHAPLHVNTWGDALYAVFDYAHDAGCFALEFAQLIHDGRDEWLAKGLYSEETAADGTVTKHPLDIRIGLHTGPVFMHYNPVTRQLGFTGVHVSRAARIEPVTTPGEVFASEEFAALAETAAEAARRSAAPGGAGGARGFVCEYTGSMPLAKGYPGRHRIYRLVPDKVFGIEELAQAIHEDYIESAVKRGATPPGANGALRPWAELAPDLKQANFAQAADIPNKLRVLGYELAPGPGLRPAEMIITKEKIDAMAVHEHDRWAQDRQRQGWTYGAARDNARKLHPLLVPWESLNEEERDKDRATVKNLPMLVEKAGFRVRRLGAA